tara:strand:+ start:2062 stop:2631 length:570 start_codon:yes stop_codon:yes gene_type:complete
MVWKKSNGTVVNIGSSWVDDNKIRHPSNWGVWTDAEKKAAGLTWTDDPQPHDEKFYSGRDSNGKLIEKSLVDVDAVDSDGNKIKDTEGNQVVYKGLKTIWIRNTKQTANDMLSKTDWEVTRKAEKGTAISSATTTFRDKVRTACDTIETKINNCSNFTEFKSLFDAPVDSNGKVIGNQPMYDWPTEETS